MILLHGKYYHMALKALEEVTINKQFAGAVLNGDITGKVYTDSNDSPSLFLVVHPYGMSLLFGKINDDFIYGEFREYMLGRGGLRTSFEYVQVFPPELEKSIDAALGKDLCSPGSSGSACIVHKYKRVNFKFNRKRFSDYLSGVDLARYSFKRVDEELFNEFTGVVVPSRFWNSASDFVEKGAGFALMHNGQAASLAFSAFKHNKILELGMETRASFRRNGYGAVVCAKLIDYCLKNDLEPDWACSSKNTASFNLALKLGFEPVLYLPYYECFIRH